MSWTDERVELLKKLWIEGLSASQIAGELGGGVTRNAVIGKVHRLKLSGRAKPVSTTPHQAQPRPTPRRLTTAPSGVTSPTPFPTVANVMKRTVLRAQTVGATALQPTLETEIELTVAPIQEVFIPKSERIGLLGLTEHTCKWPIGDPLNREFHFCGRESLEGKPYCEFHAHKAYHQIEKRKR